MSRALLALLILTLVPASRAEKPTDDFRFVRPVHAVQSKRAAKRLVSDVRTFKPNAVQASADPPEVAIGERLFMETRFSQFFAANYDGNVNHTLKQGDAVLNTVTLRGQQVPGPFRGRSINCRSCHFVAEFAHVAKDVNRTYTDFVARSPVPQRDDGRLTTPRNSMSMVDSFISRDGSTLLHADGEFATVPALVKSTMTGRNFGWLPTERDKAIAHIAKVVREDDGSDAIGYRYGGSYAKILSAKDPDIPVGLQLPKEYTLDVASASNQQILNAVARLLGAYLESLQFARDNDNVHDGSPYDRFLKLNALPQKMNSGETDAQYTIRLRRALDELGTPKFVDEEQQMTWFLYHKQKFSFGPTELQGLKIFLATQDSAQLPKSGKKKMHGAAVLLLPGTIVLLGVAARRSRHRELALLPVILTVCSIAILGGWSSDRSVTRKAASKPSESAALAPNVANCSACHTPPDFTDRRFHNNGASQEEYDAVHGAGSFSRLKIPSFSERTTNYDKYLPATPQHPRATETFRSPASESNPQAADLGMWSIFANPDLPEPQPHLRKLLCGSAKCDPNQALPRAIALFRTPPLRDLEDSNPFMHTGRFNHIEDVLRYYIRVSELSRDGLIRNGAPELSGITITEDDIPPLAAFLRSLNEDYD